MGKKKMSMVQNHPGKVSISGKLHGTWHAVGTGFNPNPATCTCYEPRMLATL